MGYELEGTAFRHDVQIAERCGTSDDKSLIYRPDSAAANHKTSFTGLPYSPHSPGPAMR